ncbi:unnamed protein product [Meganyctiphanes norvegica]|uniref:Glucuronosyltransferase n=1 Tax=Meganyctiphanes norvegica TaxID=48144 RepID=A0AAV2Q419_MEGNR
MKYLRVLAVILSVVAPCVRSSLPPAEKSYNILMLLPVASKSHRNVFTPLAKALDARGHKVVMLSNHPSTFKQSNITIINHGLTDFNIDEMNMFEARTNPSAGRKIFTTALPAIAEKLYHVPEVLDLYQRRKEFDLFIVNHMFNEVVYPFVEDMPFIFISTIGMDPRQSAYMGNPLPTSYAGNMVHDWIPPLTITQRMYNTFQQISYAFIWRHWQMVPLIEEKLQPQFPSLPPLLDLERNVSLSLLNSHFSFSQTLPLLPSQVEVGAMHCQPAPPLQQELRNIIEESPKGVIYFSLGSVAKGTTMPEKYKNIFVEAFERLDQKVIWKFEEKISNMPGNILRAKWLPQQSILAHPNVLVFISHAGLLSTQEAIYHGTPVLALPIFADQPRNGEMISNAGIGLNLLWEDLTVDLLVDSLNEIIHNRKYQDNVNKMSAAIKDQPEHPLDRAIFWTEYVIRHKGAPQLRSPAAQISWINFLNLDILVLAHLALYVIYKLMKVLLKVTMKILLGILFSNKPQVTKLENIKENEDEGDSEEEQKKKED